jgi:ribosomal protein S18 acetylase RimI-like enzyme
MKRDSLNTLSAFSLPDGYSIRLFQGMRDANFWIAVSGDANPGKKINRKLFGREFGRDPDELFRRMLFLFHGTVPVGTCTAWYDELYQRQEFGRIHWLSIAPSYRGMGLGRALVSSAVNRMVILGHTAGYLSVDSDETAAINLFLSIGFRPWLQKTGDPVAWNDLLGSMTVELNKVFAE